MQSPRPSAGVIVLDDAFDILMLQRDGAASTGPGTWSVPGGKLDPGETLAACAARELLEEAGIVVMEMTRLHTITEDLAWGADLHFISHYYLVTKWIGTPRIMEPTKHSALGWISAEVLEAMVNEPEDGFPIFEPLANLITSGGFEEMRTILKARA